jgi:hypothetical protein
MWEISYRLVKLRLVNLAGPAVNRLLRADQLPLLQAKQSKQTNKQRYKSTFNGKTKPRQLLCP